MNNTCIINNSKAFLSLAAKSNSDFNTQWLPLWMHLYDTAHVMEYLLDSRYESFLDNNSIDKDLVRKEAIFLAAIHDIGKVTLVFQNTIKDKISGYSLVLEECGIPCLKNFTDDEKKNYGHHAENGAIICDMLGVNKETAIVVASHHGRIPSRGYLHEEKSHLAQHENLFWRQNDRLIWQSVQREFLEFALCVAGFNSVEEVLHINKEKQMLLTGLVIAADWIASNTEYFPLVDVSERTEFLLNGYSQRYDQGIKRLQFPDQWVVDSLWSTKEDLFARSFGFDANIMQKNVQEICSLMNKPSMLIIEAPMGNGKTEASLVAAEILAEKFNKNGLAFFLPSQATSNALFPRLESWAKNQTKGNKLALQLAHGSFLLNQTFSALKNQGTEEDGNPELIVHQFFCGSKSFLLANFVVGTIDQLLMAAIQQKHVMLKHLGLSDKVVIIDECHAYDAYMNTYLDRILKYLYQYHVPVVVLSATLPAKRRIELLNAYGDSAAADMNHPLSTEKSYPLVSWKEGEHLDYRPMMVSQEGNTDVYLEKITDDGLLKRVYETYSAGGCIGIIVNTVAKAQMLATHIEQLLNTEVILYHAQYLLPDRVDKEETIIHKTGKASSMLDRRRTIVVGTQVLEQSLDIDFDVLITELCPMDLLLQRIGRLHRHKNRIRPSEFLKAKCFVLNADFDKLDKGSTSIYGEYLLKKTLKYLPDKIVLPTDISNLVQAVYCDERNDVTIQDAYERYCMMQQEQRISAESFLLKPLQYGRRIPVTIEGLADREIAESSARASVRDGDPSVEVILIRDNGDGTFSPLSKHSNTGRYSMHKTPDIETAQMVASEKLRLPHKLSNKWNGPKIVEFLEKENYEKVRELLKSPWLHHELILIMDSESRKNLLGRYQLQYSYEKGLCILEGA